MPMKVITRGANRRYGRKEDGYDLNLHNRTSTVTLDAYKPGQLG